MAGRDISFELARFEWVTPERLEVEGTWNGVRRLVRATLVIEVDGDTRRLRALPEDPGSPEQWTAAFAWKGGEMPKLEGAELEVGRSIVVDLPRPRTSKARGADARPAKPIPATTRADKANEAALEQLRADKESEQESLREELDSLHAQLKRQAEEAESLRAELDALRGRAESAEREREALETRAREAAEGADAARAEHESLRARASEAESLRARVEDAEAQRDALRAQADEALDLRNEVESLRAQLEAKRDVKPDVARLRSELESVERERGELRAQLDATAQRLEDATQAMPPPVPHEAPRFDRRPAERTAKRESAEATSLADKVTDWVGTVIGTRDEEEGAKNGDSGARTRTRAKRDATAAQPRPEPTAPLPARRPGRRAAAGVPQDKRRQSPSWPLRVAAIGLLALLLLTLVVIVSSIL